MVQRNLNKSIGSIRGVPPFWLRQVLKSEWGCHLCKNTQPAKSVTFEMYLRGDNAKAYLCLPCAKKVLDDAMTRIDVCMNLGADAYAMLDDL